MKKEKPKKKLTGEHQLLSLRERLNEMIEEVEGSQQQVKQALISARDITSKTLVEELEKKDSKLR